MQMLAFTQNSYLLLAVKALPLWTSLLSSASGGYGKDKTPSIAENSPIPLECVGALMDLAGRSLESYLNLVHPLPRAYAFSDITKKYRMYLLNWMRVVSTLSQPEREVSLT